MMDITTLAAANAYTDKKVGAGGGSAPSGGGLPVVVLTTECVLNEETPLSAEESAALDAAVATKTPAVVRFAYNGITLSLMFDLQIMEHGNVYQAVMYAGNQTHIVFAVVCMDDTWVITAEMG